MTLFFLTALFWAASVRCTQLVVIIPASPDLHLPPCLTQSFFGPYGTPEDRYNVYRSDLACTTDTPFADSLEAATIVPVEEEARIVYVQEVSIEQSLRRGDEEFAQSLDKLVERVTRAGMQPEGISNTQNPLFVKPEAMVLYRTSTSALISVPESLLPELDTLLPRLFVPVALPKAPSSFIPVPSDAVKRISLVLASLKFDPNIAGLVDHLSLPQMLNDIRYLTGEDKTSGIISRHSFSFGARTAANWILARIEATGAICEFRSFLVGFAPNVICRYPSSVNTTATVILGAHYDSRGSFGSTRAPGANDDGSGVISLLGIARTIKSKGILFRSNVELVAFAGEEQGLYGSRAYAEELREAGANITLMIQADMIAYHKPGEPPQLGLPDQIATPEVSQLVANVTDIYSPELYVGYTAACCSDHQSFHERGFPSTQVFERAGPIADPMYHNSGDLSNRTGYDLDQVKSIAKVTFATLLHTAGYDLESQEASG